MACLAPRHQVGQRLSQYIQVIQVIREKDPNEPLETDIAPCAGPNTVPCTAPHTATTLSPLEKRPHFQNSLCTLCDETAQKLSNLDWQSDSETFGSRAFDSELLKKFTEMCRNVREE